MPRSLFIKKKVETLLKDAAAESKQGLKRSLGAFNLTAMGIGAIIGAGIFVYVGDAAANYAGPGVIFSFMLAAFVCFLSALCYAELSAMIPISGSAYTYTYVTLGEFPAWIMGSVMTVEYLLSFSAVAVGWSGYLASLLRDFGVHLSPLFVNAPWKYDHELGWSLTGGVVNLPAFLLVIGVGYLVAVGIQAAAKINDILVITKLLVVALFIAIGIFFVQTDNWVPFIPENTGTFGHFGLSGILRGAGVVFFAFLGFDAIATLAQEARNPKRDLPLGMMGALGISTIAYVAVALVITGIVSCKLLGVADPLAVAVNAMGPKFFWFRLFLKSAVTLGLVSVVLVMLNGQSRIFYTMAHDGLLPKALGKIHHKHRTPAVATFFVTIAGAFAAGFLPINILGQLVSFGTLVVFGIVCLGVLIMRYKEPHLARPFKVPFVPWVPLLGVLSCFSLMLGFALVIWAQLLAWIAFGCLIYFLYGRKNSFVRKAL